MSFPGRAEDISGNYGDPLGVEELFGEFLGGQTGATNRRKRIECAARLRAVQADFAEALDKDTPAAIIVGNHFNRVSFAAAQRLKSGELRYMWRAEHGVLMDPAGQLRDGRRSTQIAYAPSRHGVCLRKATQQDGPLECARQSGHADMRRKVAEPLVYLVRDQVKIMLHGKLGNG